jgi:hypothetical protein
MFGVPRVHIGCLVVNGILGIQEIASWETQPLSVGASMESTSNLNGGINHLTLLRSLSFNSAALAHCALRLELAGPARQGPRSMSTNVRRCGREALGRSPRVIARKVAGEVRRLIHIDPDTGNIKAGLLVEECGNLVVPILSDVGRKPIREDRHTRPDNTQPL